VGDKEELFLEEFKSKTDDDGFFITVDYNRSHCLYHAAAILLPQTQSA